MGLVPRALQDVFDRVRRARELDRALAGLVVAAEAGDMAAYARLLDEHGLGGDQRVVDSEPDPVRDVDPRSRAHPVTQLAEECGWRLDIEYGGPGRCVYVGPDERIVFAFLTFDGEPESGGRAVYYAQGKHGWDGALTMIASEPPFADQMARLREHFTNVSTVEAGRISGTDTDAAIGSVRFVLGDDAAESVVVDLAARSYRPFEALSDVQLAAEDRAGERLTRRLTGPDS